MEETGKRYLVDEYGTVISEIGSTEYCQIKTQRGNVQWKDAQPVTYRYIKTSDKSFEYCIDKYSVFRRLYRHITYLDNVLVFDNGKPIKTTNMNLIMPYSIRTIRQQVHDMIEEDILKKVKLGARTYIAVNPWICMRGAKCNNEVYEQFENSKWKDLKEDI